MKYCSRCGKKYDDDNLNFCLDDGAVLMKTDGGADQMPATVMMNQPPSTNPNQSGGNQPSFGGQSFGNQSGAPNNWNNQNQYAMPQQPKKSKGWLWAVGILGVLAMICGGGFVGFIFWAANIDTNKNTVANYKSNRTPINSTSSDDKNVQRVDLSRWVQSENQMGTTEFKNDALYMGSKKKGYYYVLAAGVLYKTENATTKVTVKNVNEANTALGFGLIIHSNPQPLQQDYAFLIDSEKKKYRVVRHSPQNEIKVVDWTSSTAIKGGTSENVLEVRDQNKKMSFYINGELMTSVNNTDGYSGGVAGLYSGDAAQIAFSNLEISK